MANGSSGGDTTEVLMMIGALVGLCLLIAGAVTDLTLRTAAEIERIETTGPQTD